jgi:excisionase family DNA binding protein
MTDDFSARPMCVRVPTAAKMLGIGLTKMYELIGAGEVQTVKLGRTTLVPMASLEALIARYTSKS